MAPDWRQLGLNRGAWWLALLAVAVCMVVYWPGLNGTFVFDDIVNIVQNKKLQVESLGFDSLWQLAHSAVGSDNSSNRALARLSFGLGMYWLGADASAMKLQNVILHAFNFLVWWRVLLRLLRYADLTPAQQQGLALAVAAYWLLHPLQHSTVLYVVQRMTLMSALWVGLGMLAYLRWRQSLVQDWPGFLRTSVILFLCLLGGYFSKENAVLLLVYLALLELCVLRFAGLPPALAKLIRGVISLGLFILAAGILALLFGWPLYRDGFLMREWGMGERLLSQARIVWHYVHWITVPDISHYALHHDDIRPSRSLFEPVSTAFAVLAWGAVFAAIAWHWRRGGLILFAVCFFLVGHSMESTVLPLELTFEHRNYLPSLGLILAAGLALLRWGLGSSARHRFTLALFAVFSLAALLNSAARSLEWSDHQTQFKTAVSRHPQSARAHHELVQFYKTNVMLAKSRLGPAGDLFEQEMRLHADRAMAADPGFTISYLSIITAYLVKDEAVPDAVIDTLMQRLESYPVRAESVNGLANLARCLLARYCFAGEHLEQVLPLFEQVLKNTAVRPRYRKEMRFFYARLQSLR